MSKNTEDDSASTGHRLFYKLPNLPDFSTVDSALYRIPSSGSKSSVSDADDAESHNFVSTAEFFRFIDKSVIGNNKIFHSAFGARKVVYCDYIASGRALSFLEDFIYTEVLPDYGNTHTTTSVTSLQTTMYRHEAKDIVRNAVRASDYDAVFFVGSGCTGAVHKLIHNLYITKPPIVIVGPFEHHSNMLPWRHMAASITRLKTDSTGNVSLNDLKEVLMEVGPKATEEGRSLIVCLAAASNVTGILLDVDVFSAVVHKHGGLIFWDYATAAPYVNVDMNPVISGPDRDHVYKDALYFSMHKFVGGVQTPGVLVAKRALFKAGEKYPDGCGGGTVCFVRREGQVYLQDVEEREEGGTPAIVESIRAGLVMQLKETLTSKAIMSREDALVKRVWARLRRVENLLILGGDKAPRLPVFSVVVRHTYPFISECSTRRSDKGPQPSTEPTTPNANKRCLFVHHAFVATLLNDLFGIQCRAGCACAGPYAMDLLGIDEALAKLYEAALVKNGVGTCRISRFFDAAAREVLRPGFTRFSIPYFMEDEEVDFVLEAVCFVAMYGWAFLPLYTYDATTGEWRHRNYDVGEDRQWLGHIKYTRDGMIWRRGKPKPRSRLPKDYRECLEAAGGELEKAIQFVKSPPVSPVPDDTASFDEESQKLRWFLLPCEAAAQMRGEINQLAVPTGSHSPWHPGVLCSEETESDTLTPVPLLSVPDKGSPASQKPAVVDHSQQLLTQMSQMEAHDYLQLKAVSALNSVNEASANFVQMKIVKQQRNDNAALIVEKPRMKINDVSDDYDGLQVGHLNLVDEEELKQLMRDLNGMYIPTKSSKVVASSTVRIKQTKHDTGSPWKRPIKPLYKPMLQAIKEFEMILPNDRILVCLSGGKDSLSLLHSMHEYQQVCLHRPDLPSFELGAVTVDPGSSSYNPRPLIPYLAELGVPYFYEQQGIIQKASELGENCESVCSFCSRMKRGRIYAAALKNDYNVLALGQHLDDLAESFIMSCFHNGAMNTMKAHYTCKEGSLRVIRPLVFVREKVTRTFAEIAGLPVIPENCPACFQMPKERMRVKRMLTEYESVFPNLYYSLRTAMMPLMSRDMARGLSGFEDAKRALTHFSETIGCFSADETCQDSKPCRLLADTTHI